MKKNKILVLFVTSLLVFFVSRYQVNAEFSRNLKIGNSGEDVRELQIFLNTDPDTQIATSGIGSPGRETNYFGTLTYLAVKKFQTKYAYEVLTPTGLSLPTGYVGTYTLAKIARLQAVNVSTIPTNTTSTNSLVPKISYINPSTINSSSQVVTIVGENFNNNTVVLTSSGPELGVSANVSSDGKSLTFQFTFSTADKMKEQLYPYRNNSNYQQILNTFLGNITGNEIIRYGDVVYARVIIIVKNSNGQSTPANVYVDLRKAITS